MASVGATNQVGSWKRIDGIDLLRGLAIFFVLMNHVNMRLLFAKVPYAARLPVQLVDSWVWNGQYGVQMFFVVSGFLITSITLRRWTPLWQIKVRDFYLLRFARIVPLLVLLLVVLSGLDLAHVHNYVIAAKTGGLGRALFAALTFHLNLFEARHGYLPGSWDVLWSLSVEEMFYLFFPLVSRLLGRGKLFVGLLLAFVLAGPFGRTVLTHGNEIWHEYSYLGGMDAIAIGCLTALIVSRIRFSRKALRAFGIGGAAMLAIILGFSVQANRLGLERRGLDMTVIGLGTAMFIIASAQTQWRSPRILGPLLKIGQYSYEIYLTHMFVVFALFGLFLKAGKAMYLVPVLFVAVTVLSGFLGAAVARWYSEPMNHWLRRGSYESKKLASILDSEASTPVSSEKQVAV
jgi:peptidoglycan/LPS O-acetylase OafA/YrhL